MTNSPVVCIINNFTRCLSLLAYRLISAADTHIKNGFVGFNRDTGALKTTILKTYVKAERWCSEPQDKANLHQNNYIVKTPQAPWCPTNNKVFLLCHFCLTSETEQSVLFPAEANAQIV